jgi:AAA domain
MGMTDHHDMAFVAYVRRAAEEETDESGKPLSAAQHLVVFPGMELTLGVPCQALVIFDANLPDDMFPLAMAALTLNPSPDTDPKTAKVERLDHIQSLKQLKEELDKHKYLRDRYTVFPNVSDGKFSLLRGGQAGKYIEMPWVGGFVDGSLEKLGQGNRDILAGKQKEWGNKRLACFQTSDSRREDHADLGKVSTWIKWAAPTAEALRQACLAQESRVSQEEPRLPLVSIAGISVSNSAFLGPVELELNTQYNALIGGRGTGKSTILEYLRWALCDQPPGLSDNEDAPNYQARRARLIEQTLKPLKATIQVRFEVNGVPHVVRRSSEDGSLLIKIGNDEMKPCTEEEIRLLLPIQAYSQKQLSDVSVRVEELSRFITAPIRGELGRIERQLSEYADRLRQSYASRRRQRALSQALSRQELEAKSLMDQAENLRASLSGLSDDDRSLLDRGRVFEAADRAMQGWRDGIGSLRAGSMSLKQSVQALLEQMAEPPAEPEQDVLKAAHAEYLALLNDAKAGLDALIARADAVEAAGEASPWRQWQRKLQTFRDAYQAAVQRSSAHSERLQQLGSIEEQASKSGREVSRLRSELAQLSAAEQTYQAERNAWLELLKERDGLLGGQCAGLTASSGGAIRAQVKRFADPTGFVDGLKQALSGSRIQGNKIERLGESIVGSADGAAQWTALLGELELVAEYDADKDGADNRPLTPTLAAAGMTSGDVDRLGRTLKIDDWLTLSLKPVESIPVFEYRAREGEYIAFRNASAGLIHSRTFTGTSGSYA